MQDKFADGLFIGRPNDVDIAGLACDEAAKLVTDPLQFAIQRDTDRIRPPGLAIGTTQQLDGAEVVLAATDRQPLIVLAGQQRLGHRIAFGNRHSVHGIAVLVLEQGRQAVNLVVLDEQQRCFLTGQIAEGLEHALIAVEHLAIERHRRQLDIARPHQRLTRHRRPANLLQEKLR